MARNPSGEPPAGAGDEAHREHECDALIRDIVAETELTASYTGRAALDPRVLAAIAAVPREKFVRPVDAVDAYLNLPLSIGHGQTISQPFIVALMTDLLQPREDHVVLEIGTGSGYQAAVLSRLVRRVYSIEVIPALAASAAKRLADEGYDNVEVRCGDGSAGWPEHAPFDGIIVTAAARKIPAALIEQLALGGNLIIPVGGGFGQELMRVRKDAEGNTETEGLLSVAFVPLTGVR